VVHEEWDPEDVNLSDPLAPTPALTVAGIDSALRVVGESGEDPDAVSLGRQSARKLGRDVRDLRREVLGDDQHLHGSWGPFTIDVAHRGATRGLSAGRD